MKKVKAAVETITPEVAKEYLRLNIVNRPINKEMVNYYAMQMEKGQWRMNGEAICFAEGGAMVNGQHRLHAVIKYGRPVDFLVVRGCDPDSFTTYDSGKGRSLSDVFALSDILNYSGVSSIVNRYLLLSRGSTSLNVSSIKSRKISRQDMIDAYNESPGIYQQAFRLCKKCTKRMRLMAPSEVGALYVYLVKDKKHPQQVVYDFFCMLFFNEHISNNTIHLLREKLLQIQISKNITMSAKYRQAIIIKTWNCYLQNIQLKQLRWSESTEGNLEFL